MIEINLVPDIKQEMLRAQRMRNVAITISILVGVAAGTVVLILAGVLGGQVAVEKMTEGTINDQYKKLAATQDINDMITIQNQLDSVSAINDKKSITSRLLDVLAAINPAAPNDVKMSKVTLDPVESTLTIEGSASGGYPATEVFRKTILNTKVEGKATGDTEITTTPLTDDVALRDMSYGQDANGARVVRFTIEFVYPKGLFDNTLQEVRIVTPTDRIDVTDSKTRVPESLFSQPATDESEGNN